MATISKRNHVKTLLLSFQFRYSMAFIGISAAFLLFLNLYISSTLRTVLFQSKHNALMSQERLVASSLTELDTLTAETVGPVMELLNDLDVTRTLVTDEFGRVVYDSAEGTLGGRFALYPEIVEALAGNDVFYCRYQNAAVVSHLAQPVMRYGNPSGAVYFMDSDTTQGALIDAMERNVLEFSVVLEVAVFVLSLLAAAYFSTRTRRVIRSIQDVREGDYSAQVRVRGHDEIGMLAREFGALTQRLQDAEDSRRQFVSDASHELKTPLAAIKLLSDSILQNEMDADTIREFVADIGTEADRLTRMTRKLLNLSAIDSEVSEEQEVADVKQDVLAAITTLTPLAEMSFVEILPQMEDGCTVLAIEDDIHQIVFNLIDNAIKYNREDGKIWITLHRCGEQVELVVEDCGIGIPKTEMPHIFERFYRVDKARSRERGGSGLGLSLVHDMVLRNGGTVEVDARDGGGTRFTVRLPYFAAPVKTAGEAAL